MKERPIEKASHNGSGETGPKLPTPDALSMDNPDYLNAYLKRISYLAQMLEYSSQPFCLVTSEGRIVYCNPSFLNMLGYTWEELSKIRWDRDLTPQEWHYVHDHYMNMLRETGLPVRYEKEYITKSGQRIAVELLVHQFIDKDSGKPLYYSFVTDISTRKRAEDARRELEQQLADIIDFLPDPTFVIDASGRVIRWNRAMAEMTGIKAEDIIGKSNYEYALPFYGQRRPMLIDLALGTYNGRPDYPYYKKEHVTLVAENLCPALGEKGVYVWAKASPLFDKNGQLMGAIETLRDMTAHKQAQEDLRQSELKYRLVFENTPLGILHFDSQGCITAYNESLAQIVGAKEKDALIGYNLLKLPQDNLAAAIKQALNGQKASFQGDFHSTISGKTIPIEAHVAPMMSKEGKPLGGVAIVSDITERNRYEETIRHMAYHDSLTGLPNRLLIQDRISVALPQARRQNQMLALIYLDLDNFKMINDTLGHMAGDVLLQEVSKRLKSLVREGDTVARMGGDEFMFLFPGIKDAKDAGIIAEKILRSFSRPYIIDGQEIHVTASIGISVFPTDGQDVETLIKNADSALYRAKERGGNSYQVYTPAMNQVYVERVTLAKEMRRALENEEFVLYYQPLIDIKTKQIVSVEALVRWHHPEKGLIMPSKFIHIAEENGLIIPIERWVLRTACRQNKAWQDQGLAAIRVSVNISGRHFWQQDLVETIVQVLEETGLAPEYLELEITENVALRTSERINNLLKELRSLGIKIALDDFGTGHLSLSYLRSLPLDSLKIDQSFICDLSKEGTGMAIPHALISLARFLDLRVTAEGVEKPEQAELLAGLQCDQIQGFLVSRPQPAHCIADMLAQERGPATSGAKVLRLPPLA